MHKVLINGLELAAENGEALSSVLIKNGLDFPHPCAGTGRCRKCAVTVNGEKVLSCQYKISSDISVESEALGFYCENDALPSPTPLGRLGLALDLGTTTLALSLVSLDDKRAVKTFSAANPQRAFGADVISRIKYSAENGVEPLQKAVISEINKLIGKLTAEPIDKLYISGNATMLHLLLGISPSSMGTAPYTPAFLEAQAVKGDKLGLIGVNEAVTLPSISAFVGADAVAGLSLLEAAPSGKYNLLIDLGTNAEIILSSGDKILCTAAAAGPCFEGASISQGMPAAEGAICEYSPSSAFKTIGGKKAVGICGTGLIDIIAVLLQKGIVDETGCLESERIEIADGIFITQADVREFQLAKSAICSAAATLMSAAEISPDDIETLYLSGGFSGGINTENAALVGLFPKELKGRCKSLGNSSLLGTVSFAASQTDLTAITKKAEYIDLSANPLFSELFISNMLF